MPQKKKKAEIRVSLADRQGLFEIRPAALTRLARWVLEREGSGPTEVSFALVSDREIADLNRRYLGRAGPTDVLAFPQPSSPAPAPISPLGDVVVSAERAASQAGDWGKTAEEELLLCLIHGLLHLLGWRDGSPADRRAMAGRQEDLARRWKEEVGWSLTK